MQIAAMKTLYVMRHAKSSWGEPGLDDFDRVLLEKGKKRTKNIIDFLLKKEVKVDLIISSPAVRALETARIMARGLNLPDESLRLEKTIYNSEPDQFYDLFYELPSSVNQLMIIGHNPTVTDFINDFLARKIDPLSTSAIACIAFDTEEWTKITAGNGTLKFIVYPKMLD
jgi:phosphohistidine phosphatase